MSSNGSRLQKTARGVTSRRKPRLRVVGDAPRETPRHARCLVKDMLEVETGGVRAFEVFTYDEWDALPECERPDFRYVLPGIGYIVFFDATHGEAEDLEDVARQYVALLEV